MSAVSPPLKRRPTTKAYNQTYDPAYREGLASWRVATIAVTPATPAAVITATLPSVPRPNMLNPPLAAAAVIAPAAAAVTVTLTVAPAATPIVGLRPTTLPAASTTSTM